MDFKDYYASLGVTKTATEAEIKRAYRKLARKYHPDFNPGDKTAEAKFKEINEANEVLGDPEKRRKYDELGANWQQYEQAERQGGGPAPGGWSAHFGGGPGGATYRTMTPEEMREMFGEGDPFSDFFHTFFGGAPTGGRTSGGRTRSQRGQDFESPLSLTLEEAYTGAPRRLVTTRDGKDRTVDVRIPAGVKDGARVRAAGEGAAGHGGGAAGDLYLIVHVLPHSKFERRGQDLYVKVPVPMTTAVLGGEAPVPTLSGSTLRLKVPELTPAGRVFRLRGHGMPTVGKPDEKGDLYATVEVQIPAKLTPEARKHYEALRELDDTQRMNLNRYTEKAQEAVLAAQQLAEQAGHPELLPEHLLLALINQADGIVPAVLGKMNVDAARLASSVGALVNKLPRVQGGATPGLSSRVRGVFRSAEQEAERLKDEFTEH